jgi:hypothetical protein
MPIEDYYAAVDKDFAQYLKGKGFSAEESAPTRDSRIPRSRSPWMRRWCAPTRLKSPKGKADGVYGDPVARHGGARKSGPRHDRGAHASPAIRKGHRAPLDRRRAGDREEGHQPEAEDPEHAHR